MSNLSRHVSSVDCTQKMGTDREGRSMNATQVRPVRSAAYIVRYGALPVAVLVVLALGLALNGDRASAALYHPFISSFDGSKTEAGSMLAESVAVDNSSSASANDVYVSDVAHNVVDRFSALGNYLPPSVIEAPASPFVYAPGVAVDASGNLFVGDFSRGVVDEFDPKGNWLSEISVLNGGTPYSVAINASGEVFVATFTAVLKYDPLTSAWSPLGGGFSAATGVAVDNDPSSPAFGDVYVVEAASSAVEVFDPSGKLLSELTGTPSGRFPFALRDAVDPTTGDLYVTSENEVDEFSPTGAYMAKVDVPSVPEVSSVDVDGASGNVYVTDNSNPSGGIDVFGPAVIVPDATLSAATGVQPTEVTLNGHIDPTGGGEVTSCKFEYGASTTYGETVACSPSPPYVSPIDVSASVSGLSPDTAYHYRLVVGNTNGTNGSVDGTFETSGPPTTGEQAVSGVTQDTAVLRGHINPHGFKTKYHFEYGPTESYGTSVPVPDGEVEAGMVEQELSSLVEGLTLNTEYHYRLVAESEAGVVDGPDGTFITAAIAVVEDLAALAGPNEATLRVKVEDFGAASDCEVEYVTEAQFVSSGYSSPTIVLCTPQHLAGVGHEVQAVARLSGLNAGTVYHYRYVISNEFGEQQSADATFVTFGLSAFSIEDSDAEAQPYTQAGGHPFMLTTRVALNTNTDSFGHVEGPAGTVKDIRVHLPAGLIGNPHAIPQCSRYDSERRRCNAASEIGSITVNLVGVASEPSTAPLFNVVPPRGVAAEFSARFSQLANAFIVGSVRTGSDYGIDANSLNISTVGPVAGAVVRIWGVPADPIHDEERRCPSSTEEKYELPPCASSAPVRPFLTNPTSCSGRPLVVGLEADTYQAQGAFAQRSTEMPGMTGCERLHFTPAISVRPEVSAADSPSGLHVDLHIPQEEGAGGLAEADLKDATVALPKGLMVNPASAGGLIGCSEAQIELDGPKAASCPDASKVGSVELVSPLVDHPLQGSVYVAQQGNAGSAQGANKFGSLIALYVAINDPVTGVVVKLAGKVALDSVTGQLTTSFDENPQLPFEDLKLDFFGGQRAALETPPVCGTYAGGSAVFDSWAEPGTPVSPGLQSFVVSSGPGGSACPVGAFAPGFTAGTESLQAGAFSPFVLSFSREDGEQGIAGLEATLAPGLLAKLAGVPLCGDAEAAAGACPSASQIGVVTAYAGAGSSPVSVQGQVYLTGSYNGGPFGEVVEVPAVAGPFNLGTVVVRGSIRINPTTAQASVVSDAFPTMLQGVPLTLKRVVVTLDRPGFTFNPTDCNRLQVTGKLTGTGGGSAPVSAPFQVSNCAKLPFKPTFRVSTQANSSKAGGASLRVKITSGAGQANLAQIKVNLPKQLPSRFSTLQKACLLAVFDANPASCPAGSLVGTAKAVTPLLKTPFTGPAYLVSHGSSGTPDLELVLQSEGVTLIQDGKTRIKNGITSSMFKAIPDAPISSIELTLPEGPHSALAAFLPPKAKYNMCGQKLLMPTMITGQNGAVMKQTTKITVTGCPTKHKAKKAGAKASTKHRSK
jgi:hypothetical protein